MDAIVTGSITDLQSYVALNCRLIDAQTGQIFGAAQTKIVKDDDVRKIMGATPPSPGGDGEQPVRPKKPDQQQQRVGNVLFVLKKCSLSGKLVTCELLITNNGEDVLVGLTANESRLFDDEGNEYHGHEVRIGNSSSNFTAHTGLASGVPVRAQLSLNEVSPETQHATLVELRGYVKDGDGSFAIQFRDVSLARP